MVVAFVLNVLNQPLSNYFCSNANYKRYQNKFEDNIHNAYLQTKFVTWLKIVATLTLYRKWFYFKKENLI